MIVTTQNYSSTDQPQVRANLHGNVLIDFGLNVTALISRAQAQNLINDLELAIAHIEHIIDRGTP